MHYSDNFDRSLLPGVNNNITVEVPESILTGKQLFVIVANSWRTSPTLKLFIELDSQTLRSFGVCFSEIQKNLSKA